jgi:hypothetical protein
MTLDIGGGIKIGDVCYSICGTNTGRLSIRIRSRELRRSAIVVGCPAPNDGTDRVTIFQGIVQSLQNDRIDTLRFPIAVRLRIEGMTSPSGRVSLSEGSPWKETQSDMARLIGLKTGAGTLRSMRCSGLEMGRIGVSIGALIDFTLRCSGGFNMPEKDIRPSHDSRADIL